MLYPGADRLVLSATIFELCSLFMNGGFENLIYCHYIYTVEHHG